MLHPDPGKERAEIREVVPARKIKAELLGIQTAFFYGATIGAHQLRLARKRDATLEVSDICRSQKYINQFAVSRPPLRRSWQGACPGGQDRRIDIAAVRP